MPADRIELRGLRALGRCGVLAEEQARPQPLEVDLDVELDLAVAGASDDLADTIDYGALCALVEGVIVAGHVALLEHLAETIAARVLADERVDAVTVAVRKLRPPVAHELATSGVRLHRARAER
ncbi:MAG: dihydroneopterin aldolase [Acidimicrobiales bacterium]|nr:dihydroneopterin aldolase [Acidimicrobiales bacterium]MCB9371716.1 dihydroneopterin aldolase [Microthrixaceae bacterium]